jgi:hypothetical protein
MYYYAHALRRASFLMVNSSWTKNHIDAILNYSDPLLNALHLPLALLMQSSKLVARVALPAVSSNTKTCSTPRNANVVYPPCDTSEMCRFSLQNRERMLLSISQFRCVLVSIAASALLVSHACTLDHPAARRKTTLPNYMHYPISSASSQITIALCGWFWSVAAAIPTTPLA